MLLRDLDFFIALAESSSFRQAAARVGVTQPAITKAVRRLETELGLRLVDRSRSHTELNDAGAAFLKRARRLRQDLDDALREASDLRTRSQGLLRVGCAPSLVEQFFTNAGEVISEQRPAARFQLSIALSDGLFAGLRRGELDLVICSVPDPLDASFTARTIGRSTLLAVASSRHPVLQQRRLELEHLTNLAWILPRRGVLARDWLDRTFVSRGLPLPLARIEVDTQVDVLLPMAARSEMLSIASGLPPPDLARLGLAALPLEELRWGREVAAITRADAPCSPLLEHFVTILAGEG